MRYLVVIAAVTLAISAAVVVEALARPAPDTVIDSGPSGTVASRDATFTFHSTQKGSTFECSLDGSAFAACGSPQSYTGLADGTHTFRVRAIAGGRKDGTPASAGTAR